MQAWRATWRSRWSLAGAVIAAAALGGCGLDLAVPDPVGQGSAAVSRPAAAPTPSSAAATQGSATTAPQVRSNEVPTPPGRAESAPVASSPRTALANFADLYINWDAADVRRHLLALAAYCVGQARTAIQLSAVQTGADPELRQAGIANRGTVEAVAPLAGAGHRYVVITRESTSATDSTAYEGLAPAWHLTVATVQERGAGWVISGWQPES